MDIRPGRKSKNRGDAMKGFERENHLFSLCGLNCGLCPMSLGGYCGGCGNGNQSCKIARCSLEHGKIEYCYECGSYPCEKYQDFDQYDSFITHRQRSADMEKAKHIGISAYVSEQQEKLQILELLLSEYNDVRKKNFFCVAVNLLEISELREAMDKIRNNSDMSGMSMNEKSGYAADVLKNIAERRRIELKLNRKK